MRYSIRGGGGVIGAVFFVLFLSMILPTFLNQLALFIVAVAPYVAWGVGLFLVVVVVLWWLNKH